MQGLRLAGNTISSAGGAGVLLDASTASMEGNTWSENDVDLRQTTCDGVDPVDTSAEPSMSLDLCPADADPTAPLSGDWAE